MRLAAPLLSSNWRDHARFVRSLAFNTVRPVDSSKPVTTLLGMPDAGIRLEVRYGRYRNDP
jgi:hypothetical protein